MSDNKHANEIVRQWYPTLGSIGTAQKLAESGLRVSATPTAARLRAFRLGVQIDPLALEAVNAAASVRGHMTRRARAAARAAAPVPPTLEELLRKWLLAPRSALLRAIEPATRQEVTR